MSLVLVRVPLRVSFFGGATDLPAFYSTSHGRVLSVAIDKFTYVLLKSRFDSAVYANWSQKEVASSASDLKHELIREALLSRAIHHGVEVTTLADIPAGTGLGSSSSVTVGLLLAASAFQGHIPTAESLAADACSIEIDRLRKPIGRQDQYICALGGVRSFTFHQDHSVSSNLINLNSERERELQERLLLFYTGTARRADDVLRAVGRALPDKFSQLRRIRDLVEPGTRALETGDWLTFGSLLHEAWTLKKGLHTEISSNDIDRAYQAAMDCGALGGKVTGAGGGGFLLLFAEPAKHDGLRRALATLREVPIRISHEGATVVYKE